MKIGIVDRIIILLAFNVYMVANFLFAGSFIITVSSYVMLHKIPLILGYFFWFCFGLFVFSMVIRNANKFLVKQYEDKNSYYLNLLAKNKNKMAEKK